MTFHADNIIYFYLLASLILLGLSVFLAIAVRFPRSRK
jgi:hypothetical protein